MVGELSEVDLSQIENHMNIVNGLMLHLAQVANRAEQIILIIDLKKIKAKVLSNKILISALRKTISLALQYFPELLYEGFIVNAPMSFSKLWDSLASLLPASTKEKVRVIGACTHPAITALVL